MEYEKPRELFEIEGKQFDVDENRFVNFGDVARGLLQQQSQYASRYVYGKTQGYPNLAEGLRFQGDPADYHELRIHKDDIQEFIERVRAYKESRGL